MKTQGWHTLFLLGGSADRTASTLRAQLTARGYQSYDPFPGGTGTPPGLTEVVRLFVAPVTGAWGRVLGQPDEDLLSGLNRQLGVPVLYGWLTEDDGGFALFEAGQRTDDPAGFESYLRSGQSLSRLQQAFAGELKVEPVASGKPPVVALDGSDLPPEIQQLAEDKGVDPKQANRLLERLGSGLLGRFIKDDDPQQDQARALFMGGSKDIWNSVAGQRVRAIAGVLDLPDGWHQPDWNTLVDAYHVHRLRERNPRMTLMPGDKDSLAAVKNALDYIPIYYGRK